MVGCILRSFTCQQRVTHTCQQRVTHTSSIPARCRATSLIQTSVLTTTPCCHLLLASKNGSIHRQFKLYCSPHFLTVCMGQHRRTSLMSSSTRPVSRTGDAFAPLRSLSLTVQCPSYALSTVGARAFPVAAACTWNSLPQHFTSAPSVSAFRGRLKAFLFRRSFS